VNKPRVLHIITGLSTGGAERALYNLLAGGLAEGCDSAVVSLRDAGDFGHLIEDLGVPVHPLNIRPHMPGPKGFFSLRSIVRNFKPDVIQGWMYHGNLVSWFARRWASKETALVWNIRHSLYHLRNEKPVTRQVIRANRSLSKVVDIILYNSHLSRQQHEEYGFDASRGKVIANGFDTNLLCPNADKRNEMRQALGIESDDIVIGHIARFHPMKNHAGFLRAAVRVLEFKPEVVFLLAGRDVNLNNPALSGIISPCLRNRFRFLGERADIPDLMQAMDVLCMSSSWGEAFPNVIGESMACGVPCVVTDVGDSRYIVGETGVVVPALDSQALESSLNYVLNLSVERRTSMGEAARARIESRYAISKIVSQYSDLYCKLVG
jgi:glycosyltransferase involved in cell wall biosynthesis